MTDKLPAPIVAAEGWHVLHLFYKIEAGQWALLSPEEKIEAKTHLSELVAEIRSTENVQLLTFAMVSP
jgi:chlorite dismutase